ncbi:MAG: hypothetical protein J1E63_03460 [Muribaculaceae bacterium]|nr:hypothetical protein [Muribaculaceae bacterium]
MQLFKYKCFTDKGSWAFEAENNTDAMRRALYLCWRDGEKFDRIEYTDHGRCYCLRIACVDMKTLDFCSIIS